MNPQPVNCWQSLAPVTNIPCDCGRPMVAGGLADVCADCRCTPESCPCSPVSGQDAPEPAQPDTAIPPGFWETSGALRAVRQAALASMTAPEAVLVSLLCRMSAMRPAGICASTSLGKISLNMYGALLGPSSAGKSAAFGAARELYPVPDRLTAIEYRDGAPPGSGEGIAQLYFGERETLLPSGKPGRETAQVRSNALLFADEAEVIVKLGQRSGSTLAGTLRAAWTEQQVGASNVKVNTFIIEPPYALGFIGCFQPSVFAALLSDENTGTPQRFLFADCDITPDPELHHFPTAMSDPWRQFGIRMKLFRVPPDIDAEIRTDRAGRKYDGLRTKHNEMRVRIAALLAVLAGKEDIDREAWDQAAAVLAASDGALEKYTVLAEDAAADYARRQGRLSGVRRAEEKRVTEDGEQARIHVIATMSRKLLRDPGATDRDLRNAVASKHRRHINNDEWDELFRAARAED